MDTLLADAKTTTAVASTKKPTRVNWGKEKDGKHLLEALRTVAVNSWQSSTTSGRIIKSPTKPSQEWFKDPDRRSLTNEQWKRVQTLCQESGMREPFCNNIQTLMDKSPALFTKLGIDLPVGLAVQKMVDAETKKKNERKQIQLGVEMDKVTKAKEHDALVLKQALNRLNNRFDEAKTLQQTSEKGTLALGMLDENLSERSKKTVAELTEILNAIEEELSHISSDAKVLFTRKVDEEKKRIVVLNSNQSWAKKAYQSSSLLHAVKTPGSVTRDDSSTPSPLSSPPPSSHGSQSNGKNVDSINGSAKVLNEKK